MLPASLDPLQFAHRSNRSTDDAIAFTLHTVLSHLENKNTYVRMLFVDYSSAFNTIVPATLVAKLQTLGLNRSLCSWILDFLTGRSQVVRMGNNTSSPLILNTGAPQGCVLSPLLYSLYTHDCTATRAVVKSTFVESKTSPSPKRFESESRPSPKRFESESRPSPKRFESESRPSPNETVKTEKEKNNLLQNHIFNY